MIDKQKGGETQFGRKMENAAGNFWRFSLGWIALMIEHGAKLHQNSKKGNFKFQVF